MRGAGAGAGVGTGVGAGGDAGSGAAGVRDTGGAPGSAGVGGLRERKKQRTRHALSETAIALFLRKGFDAVSVAEIAEAAEVSKPTLFRYFPAKEDLVLHRFADHEGEPARVVADRPPGISPLDALHRHFLDGLERSDPVTGLNDHPEVLAFLRLLHGTPSLVARMYAYQGRSEEALAEALGGGVGNRLAAGQIIAVLRILAEENWRRIAAGGSADAVRPGAAKAARLAFDQLRAGLGELRKS
ncbi:TetR family transcriptional regulator [Streptomyces sp. NPDC051018]|uniref:TetR family transcriptional regulator n=1 Tax=Streptomyces sp. NPDC051018 TaxID=3365639 RepID=UPI0037B7F371